MPVRSIRLEDLKGPQRNGDTAGMDPARTWCAQLEAGDILYFPHTRFTIPAEHLHFPLGQQQTGSKLHKNIAYKPSRDQLTGADAKTATPGVVEQLHAVMRRYSASVAGFLAQFLAPYEQRWILDYASYRPLEEESRDLPARQCNDLLHRDAFPTRPTRGRRICASSTTSIPPGAATGWWARRFRAWWGPWFRQGLPVAGARPAR